MPEQDPQDDRRATDLLPPDPPPEPGERKIAERRVVGWKLSNRLVTRFERRPCGNSQRFWKQIEEDDPFRPAPILKRVRQDHTLYPTQRMDRIPSTAIPQTQPQPKAATPQARRVVPPPEGPPKPVHTRDLRSAHSPLPPRAPAEPEAPVDRRPPIISPDGGHSKTGRIRVSRTNQRPQGGAGIVQQPRPSAAEVRAKKEKDRLAGTTKEHKFKNRPLDDVLSIMGQLRAMEKMSNEGMLHNDARIELPPDPNKPKPKPVAAPAARVPPIQAAPLPVRPSTPPQPRPSPPVDRTPPPVDRTPPPAAPNAIPEPARTTNASGGGMNDLFGGNPNEGRVRIGKRQKTTDKE